MKTTNTLPWLAIVISILALILALVSLNNPAREKLAETSSDLQLQVKSLQQQVEINQSHQRMVMSGNQRMKVKVGKIF